MSPSEGTHGTDLKHSLHPCCQDHLIHGSIEQASDWLENKAIEDLHYESASPSDYWE